MNEYYVYITETLEKRFLVKGNNPEEAYQQIVDKYNACEIVLDANDFTGVDFEVEEI